jgi:hypothetical protein
LQAVLGIHIDGPKRRLLVRNPRLPAAIGRIDIEGLRVGASRVSLRVRHIGKRCHVEVVDILGEPVRTLVEID